MKQISTTLSNDFFYLVKEWINSCNEKMELEEKGKIEIKYIDGFIYLAYPVKGTVNQAAEDIQWTGTNSIIHVEDGKIWVAIRYNHILADMYEYQLDGYTKGNT